MITMENYSVCAYKNVETAGGTLEKAMKPVDFRTTKDAEAKVAELAATGLYSSIYIGWAHNDNAGYWNPVVGFEPTPKDWLTHLVNA